MVRLSESFTRNVPLRAAKQKIGCHENFEEKFGFVNLRSQPSATFVEKQSVKTPNSP